MVYFRQDRIWFDSGMAPLSQSAVKRRVGIILVLGQRELHGGSEFDQDAAYIYSLPSNETFSSGAIKGSGNDAARATRLGGLGRGAQRESEVGRDLSPSSFTSQNMLDIRSNWESECPGVGGRSSGGACWPISSPCQFQNRTRSKTLPVTRPWPSQHLVRRNFACHCVRVRSTERVVC